MRIQSTFTQGLRRLLRCLPFLIPGITSIAQTATISGRITTPLGAALEDLSVIVSDGTIEYFDLTDANGEYAVEVPAGATYTVTPFKDDQPLNGLSSFDLVLLYRHMTGEDPFYSPYQYIAADIDHSEALDINDTLELRKLILGIYQEFPNNTSWRFVRSNYIFPNPQNPFQPPFPEFSTVGPLSGDITGINFYGIKIGDINGSCSVCDPYPYNAGFVGAVGYDQNNDCAVGAGEVPLGNWLITAYNPVKSYHTTSRNDGTYYLSVPAGTYDLIISRPSSLWDPCTDTLLQQQLGDQEIDTVDFAAQALVECPNMQVDLSTAFLRRCFTSQYVVQYCNRGTVPAENASVVVTFDPFLEVQGSDLPWTSVSGNSYTFDLGNVGIGQCADFQVTVLVSCDAVLGQTHCSTAQIYPDTLCTPPNPLWNGANLEVQGQCNGDEVTFTIKNTGLPMSETVDYVVIEDIMIQMVGSPIQLGAGDTEVITLPANGSTWRIELEQAPYHPFSRSLNAAVEGCGTNGNGAFSTGFVTQFSFDPEPLSFDRDCRENIGSFDPNDKQGFPRGVAAEHYVPKDQELTYLIRFQNTGTDTAFNIIVLDTLSEMLDPLSFRAGASSHPYSVRLVDDRVVQFLFQNILLPDSNINEAASHGFVQFNIRPKTDLPNNTQIENEAAIYFDFNEPVITNRTRHTLGEKYLDISNVVFQPGLELDVYPNPATSITTFYLKSPYALEVRLLLFDLQGRTVREQAFPTNVFRLPTAGLTPGLYFYRLESPGGQALAAGKLAVQRGE